MIKKLENGYYVLPLGKLTDKRFAYNSMVDKLKERLSSDYPLHGHIGHPNNIESFFGRAIPDLVINSYDDVNNECHIKMIDQKISDDVLKHCYLVPVLTYKHTDKGCEIERIVTLNIIFDHGLVNREIQIG